ncbi:MAG TPA: group III truncated hemoglobin [Patescibacteria group bacterium]|nr:group III truncated hemoglobin [Patescibacteria group bacterium]
MPLADAFSEENIRALVDRFYGKIRVDALLGPIFNGAIGESDADWRPHLDRLYDFWSSLLLKTGRYSGSPHRVHQALPPFDLQLFERWLGIFAETAREVYAEEAAAHVIGKSRMIAESLKFSLSVCARPNT